MCRWHAKTDDVHFWAFRLFLPFFLSSFRSFLAPSRLPSNGRFQLEPALVTRSMCAFPLQRCPVWPQLFETHCPFHHHFVLRASPISNFKYVNVFLSCLHIFVARLSFSFSIRFICSMIWRKYRITFKPRFNWELLSLLLLYRDHRESSMIEKKKETIHSSLSLCRSIMIRTS